MSKTIKTIELARWADGSYGVPWAEPGDAHLSSKVMRLVLTWWAWLIARLTMMALRQGLL